MSRKATYTRPSRWKNIGTKERIKPCLLYTSSKPYQLRRYLDYAESEGSVCVLHLIADDPEVYAGLDLSLIHI